MSKGKKKKGERETKGEARDYMTTAKDLSGHRTVKFEIETAMKDVLDSRKHLFNIMSQSTEQMIWIECQKALLYSLRALQRIERLGADIEYETVDEIEQLLRPRDYVRQEQTRAADA